MTSDQLTYHDSKSTINPDNVLLILEGCQSMPSFTKVGLGVFKDPSLLGTFLGPPPIIHVEGTSQMLLLQRHEICGLVQ
jgi:hypothetical protein